MISRAEFASIIARYINIEPLDGEDKFTDIARLDWCKKYINALAEKGIVTGYENDDSCLIISLQEVKQSRLSTELLIEK